MTWKHRAKTFPSGLLQSRGVASDEQGSNQSGGASDHSASCRVLIAVLSRKPGEDNGNPLQYSCLENPMEGGACRLQSMGLLSNHGVGHD